MEKDTNEKSLVKVNDSFLGKIRRFLVQIFGKRENKILEVEKVSEKSNGDNSIINDEGKLENIDNKDSLNLNNTKNEEVYEDKEEIERKLMNYYESIKNIAKVK